MAFKLYMRCVRSLSQKRGSTAKFAGQDEFNVFDLKAPNSVRIKAFKNAIYQSAMGKIKVNFSPMEVNLITKLVCGLKAGEKKNVKKSLHTKVPVSYTHLDVYKRQAPINAIITLGAIITP